MGKARLALCLCLTVFLTLTVAYDSGGETMKLSSSAFADGGKIPLQYVRPGAGGKNISIPLSWTAPPPGTKSLALSVIDPHPVARDWVHWLVINLPPGTTGLPEGASGQRMPPGAEELRNSFGSKGYGGPQPPPGSGDHPYVITLYALDVSHLTLDSNASLAAFQKALQDRVLASARLTGYFGR
jgi:Raf kinase inhibitor-like YbhB/YbcL family protein